MDGTSAVVVASGLSGNYFTTSIDQREDHIRTPTDDSANKQLLAAMNAGKWPEVAKLRPGYCASSKADMGLKALAFLEGMDVCKGKLNTKAYASIYGTGAAVLTNW